MQIRTSSACLKGILTAGIFVGMILCGEVEASTKFECYVKIQDIKGNATEKSHRDWIVAHDFAHGIIGVPSSSLLATTKPAQTYGRARTGKFTINKSVDLASPSLSQMQNRSMRIPLVKVEQRWIMPDKTVYMIIVLQNVVVSSYQPSSSVDEERSTEEVTFSYDTIEWEYSTSDPGEGREGGNIDSEWDIDENKQLN